MGIRHDEAIRGALVGNATLQTLAPPQADGRKSVFKDTAPANSTLPYLIFFQQAGGRVNEFGGMHDDVYYTIKCVADNDANGKLTAEQAADEIEAVFDRPSSGVTLGDGWTLRASTVVAEVTYDEVLEEKSYHHAGRTIRLRGDK